MSRIDALVDPRDEDRVTYSLRHLLYMALVMVTGHSPSRREFDRDVRTDGFRRNFAKLIDEETDQVAVADTMDYLMQKMPEGSGLESICADLVKDLIRKRALEDFRFDGSYLFAVDGTKLHSFGGKQHCPNCLKVEHSNDRTEFFHSVVEAKLITEDGLAFSVGTEFVENSEPEYVKQDCELKAFYRLAEVLYARFPRLPVILLMDSLYANDKVLKICTANRWSYFLSFKEGSIPTLYARMRKEFARKPSNHAVFADDDEELVCNWAHNLKYGAHELHAVRCIVTNKKTGKSYKFVYLTDLRPDEKNIRHMINNGGRQRAKIENQGFNVQKNHGYNLVEGYGHQELAYKNYYYITQIAHLLLQLIGHTNLHNRLAQKPLGSSTTKAPVLVGMLTALAVNQSFSRLAKSINEAFRFGRVPEMANAIELAQSVHLRFCFDSS